MRYTANHVNDAPACSADVVPQVYHVEADAAPKRSAWRPLYALRASVALVDDADVVARPAADTSVSDDTDDPSAPVCSAAWMIAGITR